MDEIYCEDCGARFADSCYCEGNQQMLADARDEVEQTWTGMDGHAYIGNPKRSSLAMHDPKCACTTDPESWY